MFIAHLPAGYALTKMWLKMRERKNKGALSERTALFIGLAASVLPDADLFYFYLIDLRRHAHHEYWTHIPVFWALIFLAWTAAGRIGRKPAVVEAGRIAALNVFLHLVMDSVASSIYWFYPFSTNGLSLFYVPSRYGWWVWNYFGHWTFWIEAGIVCLALWLWMSDRRGARAKNQKMLRAAHPVGAWIH